ncbi:MAG: triphosphoribosyl-dephospho-CoA synthase [Halobacteriales archaeon]|nr:triphosphoribosyl-dephospho-CoA synthase [Halobacteriales archaeon]
MRSPAQRAVLAMLLEVAGTPKPGNVDRQREYPDLRFEHFLAGAIGALPGLRAAVEGRSIGAAFETAVAGMSDQEGGNTQFGTLLLLVPLVAVAADDSSSLAPQAVTDHIEATTVEDAAAFYRALEHVSVAAGDPPADAAAIDVRRGADAIPAVRDRELSLYDVMALGSDQDGVAAEWTSGFDRSFAGAARLGDLDGGVLDRTADLFIELLAAQPDTHVRNQHGGTVANEICERAGDLIDADPAAIDQFATELIDREINPGTTADITAGALFIALHRGVITV